MPRPPLLSVLLNSLSRPLRPLSRPLLLAIALLVVLTPALGVARLMPVAAAQATQPAGAASAAPNATPGLVNTPAPIFDAGLWGLFRQSFDVFTILLVIGSLISVAVIVSCLIDIRAARLLPKGVVQRVEDLAASGRWDDLRDLANREDAFVTRVLRAALPLAGRERQAIREAAELAAAEESARWFRRVEVLGLIGNLGPLVGLAGTVWGMILAFTSLGASGGQAGPADLSLGISKALFHTLLGLCLAIPCLLAFGFFRAHVDRLCTRGIAIASRVIERLPAKN
jgi:biopolymer transport protein ExbB